MSDLRPIKRALISVSDKTHLVHLAHFLCARDVEIVSTGKTAAFLAEHGIAVKDISWLTQFPEILDGRVKTLNARVFASILFDRAKESHWQTITEHDIAPVDLVVVNLYPFLAKAELNIDEARLIEFIDVGGPSMLRAAAKNFASIAALTKPDDYQDFIAHYAEHNGTTLNFRRQCAVRVFSLTASYDHHIAQTLQSKDANIKEPLVLTLHHEKSLRYGENPHQRAALYSRGDGSTINLASTPSDAGKELSYNNLLDAHAAIWALRCLADHKSETRAVTVIIKHGIPCGAALAPQPHAALIKALASDPISAFGGIIAQNCVFDLACAKALGDGFLEVIIAPGFSADALEVLANRKNLRLLSLPNLMTGSLPKNSMRTIFGGALVQDFDFTSTNEANWSVPTTIKPSLDDHAALDFAFRIAKATPSNAISLASKNQLIGLGAGQPNRIQAVELAIQGALSRGCDLSEAALGSDAFFPFDDGIKLAHRHGIRLIIQPGGSVKDRDIVAQANDLGLCMVFTHQRHFRH